MQYVMSIERFAEERGIEKERKALILRQLNHKLGILSDETRDQIQGLSMDQLEELGEALLDFAGLVDLEDWLKRQAKGE